MEAAARARALTIAGAAVAGLACALWLLCLGLFAHHVTTIGSPPRVASWDGPPEDDNLPGRAFLAEDEAWLLRSGSEGSVLVRVDLARGAAETGWDLSPLGERSARVEGVALRDDGALTLIVARRGLSAFTFTRDRRVVAHGSASVDPYVGVLGVIWVGDTLRAALANGQELRWREGDVAVLPIDGCPAVTRERDVWLAAARWQDASGAGAGWDVLVWERPDRWRWTRDTRAAEPTWAARFGGVSLRHPPFDERVPVGPPSLGPPPNPEVRARSEPGSSLRSVGPGRWEDATAAGGFWDWCLPRGAHWVCVSHAAFEHRTHLFDDQGHDGSRAVHERFAPADPVIVEASGGGFWVLDLSNTSEDGRIFYRLNDDLTRADPLGWLERYRRARPTTEAEARVWQATSGPSARMVYDDDGLGAVLRFLATVELPFAFFAFPIALLAFVLAALALRVQRRGAALLALGIFGGQLLLALLTLPGFLHLLSLV